MPARPSAIAIVSHYPFPQNHGDALRRLMLLKSLEQAFDLVVLATEREDTTDADRRHLHSSLPSATVLSFPLDERFAGPSLTSKLTRLTRALARRHPSWMLRQWSSSLDDSRALRNRYDYGFLIGEPSGLHARHVDATKVLWDKSNVLAASEAQNASTNPSVFASNRSRVNQLLSRSFESAVLKKCDAVWVTSTEERDRLNQYYDAPPSSVLPSAIPVGERGAPPLDKPDFLWMSTFGYEPNWRGLLMTLDAIDRHLVDSNRKLHVFGAGATESQRRTLAKFESVMFHGFVEDLYDMHRYGSVAIVPIWSGAGVKLKSLALMEHGFPVIATPIALEGIDHDLALSIASSPAEFAKAVDMPFDRSALEAHATTTQQRIRRDFSESSFADAAARSIEQFTNGATSFQERR